MGISCNVCHREFGVPLYESSDELSITTMNKLVEGKTRVYFCFGCGHLQTNELPNLKSYYADEYEINLESEDDDQIYAVVDGRPTFRADHQAAVLLSKVTWFPGCRVLDYGCAKATTLKKVLGTHPNLEIFLFDVTDKYVPFWQDFPTLPNWSVHEPNPAWFGSLDLVLSFYALEHISDLYATLTQVKSLLKPRGIFYFIVPNVFANAADFIVADHINHFSHRSLQTLLTRNGFNDIEINDTVHNAAFVVTARIKSCHGEEESAIDVKGRHLAAYKMAQYWRETLQHIREFTDDLQTTDIIAIYGAGFYGNLIASLLPCLDQILCFVDQNPHLQGSEVWGKKVLSPVELPKEVTVILVGLNPRTAPSVIGSILSWRERKLIFLYL